MPEPRHPTTALLLDLDGTIADTHNLIFDCMAHTLREHAGLRLTREQWERQYIGMPLHAVYAAAFAEHGRLAPPMALAEEMTQCYRSRQRALDAEVRAFPGVPEALRTLRDRRVRLAVVTTKHEAATTRTLATLGLGDLFETVVCGDHCAHYKPHPEPFLVALRRMGRTPDEAVGVGDSRFDIEASRTAGARTAAALWGALDRDGLLAAGPDHALAEPMDLLACVKREV